MARILHFTSGPASWKALLADPEKQWRTRYSARTLAHAWEAAEGFLPEVSAALANTDAPALAGLEPLVAVPEFKVSLPGGERASSSPFDADLRAHDSVPPTNAVAPLNRKTFMFRLVVLSKSRRATTTNLPRAPAQVTAQAVGTTTLEDRWPARLYEFHARSQTPSAWSTSGAETPVSGLQTMSSSGGATGNSLGSSSRMR